MYPSKKWIQLNPYRLTESCHVFSPAAILESRLLFLLVLCWLYSFFRNTVVYNVLLMYWKIIDQDRVLLMRILFIKATPTIAS